MTAPVTHHHLRTVDGELTRSECTDLQCPMTWGCRCGPDERCFECATDEEAAAAIPDWPSL